MEPKQTAPKWRSILRVALLCVCGAIIGINIYLANANRLVGNSLPMPMGVGAAVVLSDSMVPTFVTGDLIVVKETDAIEVEDIVVYQEGRMLVVHRVVAIDGDTVTTRGDANNADDAPIPRDAIKGRVLFHIPYVGHVVDLLKTPIGTIGMLAAAIALIEIPRRRDKKRDEQTREQLLEEIRRLKEETPEETPDGDTSKDNP